MKTILAVLSTLALAMPAMATPTQREVIAYDELMVLVPSLEHVGYSRITTVEHCAEVVGVEDYTNLTTDSELEGMEACLIEHT